MKKVSLNITNDDPQVVAFFEVADKTYDAFHKTLSAIIPIPQSGRRQISLHRLTIYHGTLFDETVFSVPQLVLLDAPRIASLANRQAFEYSVRIRYMHKHDEEAESLLDSLHWRVSKEADNAGAHFSPELRKGYAAHFKEWRDNHPELESMYQEGRLIEMARDVLGNKFDSQFFQFYAYPSILAHGKPHGIIDVLQLLEPNGAAVKHQWESVTVDGLSELSKIVFLTIDLLEFLTRTYGLDMSPVIDLNDKHRRVQSQFGYSDSQGGAQ